MRIHRPARGSTGGDKPRPYDGVRYVAGGDEPRPIADRRLNTGGDKPHPYRTTDASTRRRGGVYPLPLAPLLVAALLLITVGLWAGEETTDPPEVYASTPDAYQPFGNFTEPYERFFLEPTPYRGHGRTIPEPEHVDSVKIGFLGPIEHTVSVATGGASHEEPLGRMMLKGAQLAINHANSRGGYRGSGTPYELVVRNDNGLWGASGSEIVHLAYIDKVWGILGTIDGANSHIAIRVALKIEIPMINTGDTDPTFIETNIPWVFRNITDDRQMGYLLADYVFGELGLTRVAALRANNRYGRIGIDEFRDAATRRGHPFLAELNYPVGDTDFRSQLQRIKALEPEVVITWGDAQESALILQQMRSMGMDQLFVGSDRMVSPDFITTVGQDPGPVVAGHPYDPSSTDPRRLDFVNAFRDQFHVDPETYASHAYDGVSMLIDAIEGAGLNRALIRDQLAEVKSYHGVTGHKVYDAVYSNRSQAYLAFVENGSFVFKSREQVVGEGS